VKILTKITIDHICASAAIPLVFKSVKLRLGKKSAYFGDGCIRMSSR